MGKEVGKREYAVRATIIVNEDRRASATHIRRPMETQWLARIRKSFRIAKPDDRLALTVAFHVPNQPNGQPGDGLQRILSSAPTNASL